MKHVRNDDSNRGERRKRRRREKEREDLRSTRGSRDRYRFEIEWALPFCSKCIFRRHTPFRLSPPEQEDPSILYADLISFEAPPTLHRILFHATDTFNKYRDEAIEGREDFDKFVEYFFSTRQLSLPFKDSKNTLLLRRISFVKIFFLREMYVVSFSKKKRFNDIIDIDKYL